MSQPAPEKTKVTQSPTEDSVQVAQVIGNLGHEMAQALRICVNVEEIIADRLLAGGVESNFARVELQNIDRLIQMLTDFQALAENLEQNIQPQSVDPEKLRENLVVEDLSRRLLADKGMSRLSNSQANSEITFF